MNHPIIYYCACRSLQVHIAVFESGKKEQTRTPPRVVVGESSRHESRLKREAEEYALLPKRVGGKISSQDRECVKERERRERSRDWGPGWMSHSLLKVKKKRSERRTMVVHLQ